MRDATRPWRAEGISGAETSDGGRWLVYLGRGHRYANVSGVAWRSRAIMAYRLGRRLSPSEHVDHINGIVDDDRPENLRLMPAREHLQLHIARRDAAGGRGPDGRFRRVQGRSQEKQDEDA